MKSISWDDAFLIFDKLKSEQKDVGFMRLKSVDLEKGTARASGIEKIRVLGCSPENATIDIEIRGKRNRCDLRGVTFRYAVRGTALL